MGKMIIDSLLIIPHSSCALARASKRYSLASAARRKPHAAIWLRVLAAMASSGSRPPHNNRNVAQPAAKNPFQTEIDLVQTEIDEVKASLDRYNGMLDAAPANGTSTDSQPSRGSMLLWKRHLEAKLRTLESRDAGLKARENRWRASNPGETPCCRLQQ